MSHLTAPFDPGTPLRHLVDRAVPPCRQAERELPPRGPGRPVEFPEWVPAVLILIALAKRLRTKSAQYRYLAAHGPELIRRLGLDRSPTRSTYCRRCRSAGPLLAVALTVHAGRRAARGHLVARCVAADKSLIAAAGPVWHQGQRRRGERPKGVDPEATWSRSEYDDWVYGYGLEVIVSAPRRGVVWPLAGSVDPAHVREARTFPAKIPRLPGPARYVLVDVGYDSNDLGEAVEYDEDGRRTGRRLVGPQQVRYNARRPPKRVWRETRRRKLRRGHREARRRFYESRFGRRLYKRRGRTVEPFFGRFKALFGLEEHVWHAGLGYNRTRLLGCLLLYQLLLVYNRIKGDGNAEVKWTLDLL